MKNLREVKTWPLYDSSMTPSRYLGRDLCLSMGTYRVDNNDDEPLFYLS